MQTLDIKPGQTAEEHAAAREGHLSDLRGDIKGAANTFFWAAGLALLSSGLLPVRVGILINLGAVDLAYVYGHTFGRLQGLVIAFATLAIVALLVALGAMARLQKRWAFMAGIVVYALDSIALMATFSLWSVGVHAFFLMRWYQGQKAVAELRQSMKDV